MLVVTADEPPFGPLEEGWEPDLHFAVECPGVEEGNCAAWLECDVCRANPPDEDSDLWDAFGIAHGVDHQVFNVPCTETDQCYVQWVGGVGDWGGTEYDISGGKPGRYPVDYDASEPGDCYLLAIAPTKESS